MRLTCLILATVGLVTPANAEFVMVSPPAAETDAKPAPPSSAPMSTGQNHTRNSDPRRLTLRSPASATRFL